MDECDGELEPSIPEPKKSLQKEIIDTGLPRENPIRKDLGASQQSKLPLMTSEIPQRLQPIPREPELSKAPSTNSVPQSTVPILKQIPKEQNQECKPNFIPPNSFYPRQDSLPNSGPPVLGQKNPTNPFFNMNPSKTDDNPSSKKPQSGNESPIKPEFKPSQAGGGNFLPPGININNKPTSADPFKPFVGTESGPKPFVESSKAPTIFKPPTSAHPVSLSEPPKTDKIPPAFDETSKNPVSEADMRNLSNSAMPIKKEDINLPPILGTIPPPKLFPSEPGKTEPEKISNAPFANQMPFKNSFNPPGINPQINPIVAKPPSNPIPIDNTKQPQFVIPTSKPLQSSSNEPAFKLAFSPPEGKPIQLSGNQPQPGQFNAKIPIPSNIIPPSNQPNIGIPGFKPPQPNNDPGLKQNLFPPNTNSNPIQGISAKTNFIPPTGKVIPPQGSDSKDQGPKPTPFIPMTKINPSQESDNKDQNSKPIFVPQKPDIKDQNSKSNVFIPGFKPNTSQELDKKDPNFKPAFIPPGAKNLPLFKTNLNPDGTNPPSNVDQIPKVGFVPPQGSGNIDQKSKGIGFPTFIKPSSNANPVTSESKNVFIPPPQTSQPAKEPIKSFVPPPVLTSETAKNTQFPIQVPKTAPEQDKANLPKNPPFISSGPPPSLQGKTVHDPKPPPFTPESNPLPKPNSPPAIFPVQKDMYQGAKPSEPPNLSSNPLPKPTYINLPNSQALNLNLPEAKKIEQVFTTPPSFMTNKLEPKNPFVGNTPKLSSSPPNVMPEIIKQGPAVIVGQEKPLFKPSETKTAPPALIPPMKFLPSDKQSQNPSIPLIKPSGEVVEKKVHEKQFETPVYSTNPINPEKNYSPPFIPSIIDTKAPINSSETKDTGFPPPFIPSVDLSKVPQNKAVETQAIKPQTPMPNNENIMKNFIKPQSIATPFSPIPQSDKQNIPDDKSKLDIQGNKDNEPKIPSVSDAKPQFKTFDLKPSATTNFVTQAPIPSQSIIHKSPIPDKEIPQTGNLKSFYNPTQNTTDLNKISKPADSPGYETVPARHDLINKSDNETSSNLSKSRLSTRQAPVYLPSPQPPSLKRTPTRPQESSVSSKLSLINLLITLINPEKSTQVKDMIVKVCPELKEVYPKICENIFEKINNICYCNFCKKNETRFELACSHKLCHYCATKNLINIGQLSTLPELGCPLCMKKISYQDLENIYPKEKISERYTLEANLIDKALNMDNVICAKCKKSRAHDMFYDKSCLHMCKECISTSIRWKRYECDYCGGTFGDSDKMNIEKKYCDGCKTEVYYIGDYVKKMNDGCFLCSNCLQDTFCNKVCKSCFKHVNQQELCEIDGFLYDICNLCGNEFDILSLKVLMCCKNLVCERCSVKDFCEFCEYGEDQEN